MTKQSYITGPLIIGVNYREAGEKLVEYREEAYSGLTEFTLAVRSRLPPESPGRDMAYVVDVEQGFAAPYTAHVRVIDDLFSERSLIAPGAVAGLFGYARTFVAMPGYHAISVDNEPARGVARLFLQGTKRLDHVIPFVGATIDPDSGACKLSIHPSNAARVVNLFTVAGETQNVTDAAVAAKVDESLAAAMLRERMYCRVMVGKSRLISSGLFARVSRIQYDGSVQSLNGAFQEHAVSDIGELVDESQDVHVDASGDAFGDEGAAYKRRIAKRLLDGRIEGAKSGCYQSGPAPYGYVRVYPHRDRSKLMVNEPEADMVRFIFSEYLRRKSMNRLIAELEARNSRTRRGKHWSRAGISWILRNDTYVGRVHFGKIKVKGNHPAIIAPIIFNKVQILIRKNTLRKDAREKTAVDTAGKDANTNIDGGAANGEMLEHIILPLSMESATIPLKTDDGMDDGTEDGGETVIASEIS